jgi:tripartite-type tricarboxylate transporter receptor subunit TctC
MKAGKLRAIGLTGLKRSPMLPDLPTVAETLPGFESVVWHSMVAPAKTPKPIVDKLYASVVSVLTKPEEKEGLAKKMMSVEVSKSPQEFSELVRKETQSWGEFLREAKIRVD